MKLSPAQLLALRLMAEGSEMEYSPGTPGGRMPPDCNLYRKGCAPYRVKIATFEKLREMALIKRGQVPGHWILTDAGRAAVAEANKALIGQENK